MTDEAAKQILPGGQGSWDTRQVLSSIRRDADGRLLLGSLGNGNQKPTWFLKAWAEEIEELISGLHRGTQQVADIMDNSRSLTDNSVRPLRSSRAIAAV